MTVLSAAVLLFLVMDPFGNIPLFLTALRHVDERRQRHIILREQFIALAFLILFMFSGRYLLDILQISEPSLSIAGAIILFLISINMIFPTAGGLFDEKLDGEPFIVPLAIPYIAGPSALASVLLIMSREPERWSEWLIALLLAWVTSGIIVLLSSGLRRVLGERGLVAMERLMGMILTAIAVQMFMTGVRQFLLTL